MKQLTGLLARAGCGTAAKQAGLISPPGRTDVRTPTESKFFLPVNVSVYFLLSILS